LTVSQFARATEQLAKTDKIDARIIAEYKAVVQPRAFCAVNNMRLLCVYSLKALTSFTIDFKFFSFLG
jgi:hypothetical protein